MKRHSKKPDCPGCESQRKRRRTIWRRRTRAREIRRCPAGFSFAFKRLQHVFRKRGGQFGVAGHEPEKFAGVQQDFHLPSNVCNTSSGSGALKSSGTVNWPLARPLGRRCASGGGGRMVSRPEAFSGRVSVPFGRTCP